MATMKIAIQADNTLHLPMKEIINQLNAVCCSSKFSALDHQFRIETSFISAPRTHRTLPQRIHEMSKAFDCTILLTSVPYDNNFFYEENGGIIIASTYGWNLLTDLPVINGVFYFVAVLMVEHLGIGETHDENRGCINDFLTDKRGVDVGMRAASLCPECRAQLSNSKTDARDLLALLDLISRASRSGISILEISGSIPQNSEPQIDLFLCHNSADKLEVRELNESLKESGVRTWIDEDDLDPGDVWQDEIQAIIPKVRAAGACVGASGLGPWQRMEIKGLLSEFVEREVRVVPIILPNAGQVPELPLFLRQFSWLDLRHDTTRRIERLVRVLKKSLGPKNA